MICNMVTDDKRLMLQKLSFGGRTAEEEAGKLADYFVETEQWRQVWDDEVDVVFAPKGGGKSAIYSMLVSRENQLFDQNIILIPAENPTGTTAFEGISNSEHISEDNFKKIWSLYFLALLVEELEDFDVASDRLTAARSALASIGLVSPVKKKQSLLVKIKEALEKFFTPESFEAGLSVDPMTGGPTGFNAKITFNEPSTAQSQQGVISVDDLLEDINSVLDDEGLTAWLILDRLDVAFAASPELEGNALRALFRSYKLIEPHANIRLKIFLRSDIWADITAGGFRETSHITRDLEIKWNRASLLRLITQRMMQSEELQRSLGPSAEGVSESSVLQKSVFDTVFPRQVDEGSKRPETFDWAISRCEDGKKIAAPRELIHMFSSARDSQMERLDNGQANIPDDSLFEPQAFKDAYPVVSETRLQKTIYPEYPWLRGWLEDLRGQKTLQDEISLAEIWGVDLAEAGERIDRLAKVGFFEVRGPIAARVYWVPFLYRPALEMIQGAADGVKERQAQGGNRVADDDD